MFEVEGVLPVEDFADDACVPDDAVVPFEAEELLEPAEDDASPLVDTSVTPPACTLGAVSREFIDAAEMPTAEAVRPRPITDAKILRFRFLGCIESLVRGYTF